MEKIQSQKPWEVVEAARCNPLLPALPEGIEGKKIKDYP